MTGDVGNPFRPAYRHQSLSRFPASKRFVFSNHSRTEERLDNAQVESDNQITVKFDKNKPARQSKTKRMRKAPVTRSGKSGRVISATRAARSFSELLDRVCYRGESFVIKRGGELVCEMSRVKPPNFTGADFLSTVRSLPKPDARFWKVVKETTRQRRVVPESPWES